MQVLSRRIHTRSLGCAAGVLTLNSLGVQGPTNGALSLHGTGVLMTQGPPVCQAQLHSRALEAAARVLA